MERNRNPHRFELRCMVGRTATMHAGNGKPVLVIGCGRTQMKTAIILSHCDFESILAYIVRSIFLDSV